MTHWSRISRDRTTDPRTTTLALQVFTGNCRNHRNLFCTNPNCRRQGHTIEDCYWEGGGKAGAFPPNFRKKKGSTPTSTSKEKPAQTSANLTTTSSTSDNTSNHEVVALAAITEVSSTHDTKNPNPDHPIDNTRNLSLNLSSDRVLGEERSDLSWLSSNTPLSHLVYQPDTTVTLLDSSASDHCFVGKEIFEHYEHLNPPRIGHSAGKDSTFNIEGIGRAVFLTNVKGATLRICMDGALHTPHLRSNLISVSKLVSKGSKVSFAGEKATVCNVEGRKQQQGEKDCTL
jgi:hypothetical protein